MRHRPTEVKAVVALLEQDHDDVEALAQELLDTLVELKWSRSGWVVVLQDPAMPTPLLYGPYATPTQARRDIGKRIVGVSSDARGFIHHVTNLDSRDEPHTEVVS